MIVFATSDKGGTGRSVTCANIAYRRALDGDDVAYVDFDFGSPTAAAVFELTEAVRGVEGNGVHSCLQGHAGEPDRLDVWSLSERKEVRASLARAGRLCLVPGDRGGGEFPVDDDVTRRCVDLFLALEAEFDVTIVDLSAGRSYAIDIALRATAAPELSDRVSRWLVFHRWTHQHITATEGLVHGDRGILRTGAERGHDERALAARIRYVRAAVPDLHSPNVESLRPEQVRWLQIRDADLTRKSARAKLGRTVTLGTVPLDPVLQWNEQLITDDDVRRAGVANAGTADAFTDLARALTDDDRWTTL
ncbi:SCO2523 family variant P-loop protein [Streptomyces sp. NBC_00459]|uniref:SCO2523 family variant P-loop protein n=1 Tax=Streptomyces sp. NBC_00459 TaxID=2975749 RepID=UPI002E1782C1